MVTGCEKLKCSAPMGPLYWKSWEGGKCFALWISVSESCIDKNVLKVPVTLRIVLEWHYVGLTLCSKAQKSLLDWTSLYSESGMWWGGLLAKKCDTIWWSIFKQQVCDYPIQEQAGQVQSQHGKNCQPMSWTLTSSSVSIAIFDWKFEQQFILNFILHFDSVVFYSGEPYTLVGIISTFKVQLMHCHSSLAVLFNLRMDALSPVHHTINCPSILLKSPPCHACCLSCLSQRVKLPLHQRSASNCLEVSQHKGEL